MFALSFLAPSLLQPVSILLRAAVFSREREAEPDPAQTTFGGLGDVRLDHVGVPAGRLEREHRRINELFLVVDEYVHHARTREALEAVEPAIGQHPTQSLTDHRSQCLLTLTGERLTT
jgi:hypothetical protein